MTRETAKEYLPLVQALAEGKLQELIVQTGEWVDCIGEVTLHRELAAYRIKPEPRRWFLVETVSGWIAFEHLPSIPTGTPFIEVMEVIK